jgi:hypothetical protein
MLMSAWNEWDSQIIIIIHPLNYSVQTIHP